MKRFSFRLQIGLLSMFISAWVMAGFGTACWMMISRQKFAGLDGEIRSLAGRHPGWFLNRRDVPRLEENLRLSYGEELGKQVIVMVRDVNDGKVRYQSAGWPAGLTANELPLGLDDDPQALVGSDGGFRRRGMGRGPGGGGMGPGGMGGGQGGGGMGAGAAGFTKLPKFFTVGSPANEWRVGMFGNAETTVLLGRPTAAVRRELNHLGLGFLLALPLALLVVGGGGWWLAGRALRPLRVIASTVEQVTASGLDQRIPMSGEAPEIARVIVVLNRMMDRLEKSFQQATRFSADASHELKTPLAVMQGELENALQEAAADSPEQRLFSDLLEEVQRLKTITRGLLLLARADAGQLQPVLAAVDLTTMVEELIEEAREMATDPDVTIEMKLARGVEVAADSSLLRQLLLNLIVNALRYNEVQGGRVEVVLEKHPGRVVLRIGNTGAGIAAEDHERVFTRFFRGDPSRRREVDGVGLGLSLAREIARAHGGELSLHDARPGWTAFLLELPA